MGCFTEFISISNQIRSSMSIKRTSLPLLKWKEFRTKFLQAVSSRGQGSCRIASAAVDTGFRAFVFFQYPPTRNVGNFVKP
jgi:hypothetical protein